MHAHTDCKLECISGSAEDLKNMRDIFKEKCEENGYIEEDDKSIYSKECYGPVWYKDYCELAREMALKCKGASFKMSGIVDTSESAGECMDFEIIFDGEKLIKKCSCWYTGIFISDKEDAREFLIENGIDVTDEFIDAIMCEQAFALERSLWGEDKDTVVFDVPLDDVSEEVIFE